MRNSNLSLTLQDIAKKNNDYRKYINELKEKVDLFVSHQRSEKNLQETGKEIGVDWLKFNQDRKSQKLFETIEKFEDSSHCCKLKRKEHEIDAILRAAERNFRALDLYPKTTVQDYLRYTTINKSLNDALSEDWNKVGDLLWMSWFKHAQELEKKELECSNNKSMT
ncbi:hypothetical protein VV869_06025 [Photobacterium sp. MCCC 1A19761]|uniref:hypothetical protein n=1 Tax=Photobacterium sp. MCCC 1A19761 TaxID=3115000 RepID=UPI00307DAB76